MKQIFNKSGKIALEEVPTPLIGNDEVLVHVHYSCISAGTEISTLKGNTLSSYTKLAFDPQNVKRILDVLRTQGPRELIHRVQSLTQGLHPIGYSAAGVVLDAGKNISDIKAGDRVACAGAGIANHAEFIAVPRNLLVKVPENIGLDLAATTTLGSIALQGVRRADPKIGETVAVLGLGILGQMTVQILRANGCNVLGIDINQHRIEMARSLGLELGINSTQADIVQEAKRFSQGFGVDIAILTASTESDELINQAMKMCRRKGKVVIVGAVGLNLQREDFYKKELDVLISTSYGPGRYDETYELQGHDYPYAYVRWTENRNMAEYLSLLAQNRINIQPLIQRVFPIDQAALAYESLGQGPSAPLITLLQYATESKPERRVIVSAKPRAKDRLSVGVIGAGGFCQGVLLPQLRRLAHRYHIHAIATKTGHNSLSLCRNYQAAYATTDYKEILRDPDVDMVIIATRHHLHAPVAIEAAKAGKAIFLEKPMALNPQELSTLTATLEETKVPFLVGFNRRFSPFAQRIKTALKGRKNPCVINYRMNAGFLPPEHWVHSAEGGGRNIGEACHIYDLFTFLTDGKVESVAAQSIGPIAPPLGHRDNFIATIKFSDGSLANLIYTSLGSSQFPKEQMDIFCDGQVIRLDDYRQLDIHGKSKKTFSSATTDKGHFEELQVFGEAVKSGSGWPIPLWQLEQATMISFSVEDQIKSQTS